MVHRLLVALLVLVSLGVASAPTPAAAAECATFPETGKLVCDRFLAYWQENGGLIQQGLPLSDAFIEVNSADGKPYLTQYFERARFELHPENNPPYDVLLGLLGLEQFAPRYPGVLTPVSGDPFAGDTGDRQCERFDFTNETVCGPFLRYWHANGGLAQQGYPISPVFLETNLANGKTYPVQYFERARFEFHAENANTQYAVLLGQLGREQYDVPILRDDFSDKSANWYEAMSGIGEARYTDGAYLLKVAVPRYSFYARAQELGTVVSARVSVDARWVAGDNQTNVAIRCRHVETEKYYAARFFPTGYYDIYQSLGSGSYNVLASGRDSDIIRIGLGATNRLEFACIGDTLTLGANGKTLLSVREGTYNQGGIFLAVSSTVMSQTGAEAIFDNFLALRP